MADGGISPVGVAVVTVGGFLLYTGVKNRDVVGGLREILKGQPIAEGPRTRLTSYQQADSAISSATGGAVTGATLAAGGVGLGSGGRSVEKLIALAKSSGLNVRATSTDRPGAVTSSGHVSLHASGRAVDFAGPDMGRLAQWFYDNHRGRLLELIYSGSPKALYVKRGVPVAPYAVADHYDHVHVAANGDAL